MYNLEQTEFVRLKQSEHVPTLQFNATLVGIVQ